MLHNGIYKRYEYSHHQIYIQRIRCYELDIAFQLLGDDSRCRRRGTKDTNHYALSQEYIERTQNEKYQNAKNQLYKYKPKMQYRRTKMSVTDFGESEKQHRKNKVRSEKVQVSKPFVPRHTQQYGYRHRISSEYLQHWLFVQ